MSPDERDYVKKCLNFVGATVKWDFENGRYEGVDIEPKTHLWWTAKSVLKGKRIYWEIGKAFEEGRENEIMDEVEITLEDRLELDEIVNRTLNDLGISGGV